ncbi:sugar transferase [Roseococcus sp. SDR]|uniref:sugar transferase n=1 Tax=Roseococcus sp. SDR TaxID=2835532 RepID=UPI001BCB0211|nr:sugar transferase [Roseococcus sp. SDR]MBS7792377.1 sugar transferase [Roseococcus sp. SDR]MBV1847691.1 sugar transferase [Roseococcus sp. SDR]
MPERGAFGRGAFGRGAHAHGAYARWGKRGFDIVGAILLLALGLPLLAGTALAVRLRLGRPVLFRQWRAGRDGVPFRLVKLRSMEDGAGGDAARLGPLGRALRASALDELPQLFQVLSGRMSLVGPRPLLPEYGPRYTPRQATRLLVRPGLCGLAQSKGRNRVPWEERLEWDARYVERITFAGDLRILWDCARMLWRGEGATMPGHATTARFDAPP